MRQMPFLLFSPIANRDRRRNRWFESRPIEQTEAVHELNAPKTSLRCQRRYIEATFLHLTRFIKPLETRADALVRIKREIKNYMNFAELGLHPALVRRCAALDYETPTPIQQAAIPVILSGRDLIGTAETGTGKTAAFLLPLIQKLSEDSPAVVAGKKSRNEIGKPVRALILAPTRELVLQIAENLSTLDAARKVRAVTIIGGASANKQRMELMRGAEVAIATPGRLIDHMESGTIKLREIETLILDEADRMLDMGFLPAIKRIIAALPVERQTLMFSATMSSGIESLAYRSLRDPQRIEMSRPGRAAVTIKQMAYSCSLDKKIALLTDLLEREKFERVIIFARTRRSAERLWQMLSLRKHRVERIHADRSQPQRAAAMRSFSTGQCRILVATDIAARGIDVDDISHVINFDLPDVAEDYVHRIGRSGRAGREGAAISLVTPADELVLRDIEKLTQQKIERVVLTGFGGMAPVVQAPKPSFAVSGWGGSRGRSFAPRRAGR
jgi:ATP-dependent RNA helicase RhlE